MKKLIVEKKGKELVFEGENTSEVMKKVYKAGSDKVLGITESITITDRLLVLTGTDKPGEFSWTENVTPAEIEAWQKQGSVRLVLEG